MSASDASARRFMILGFPRSGTTLLSRVLDAHPGISCPPETNLFSAAGRFLSEQSDVEGPPIGVLGGLSFLDIAPDEIMTPLREMIFGFHERIAGDAPVWVEKTATDLFHLDALEPMLAGHMKFILLLRNPLDVVASNVDLADTMGAQLRELREVTQPYESVHEGFAHAWVDRVQALDGFAARHPDACHWLRYEDLVDRPAETIAALLHFMGCEGEAAALIEAAFATPPRIGLGDFRFSETSGIVKPSPNGWRKRLPRGATSRIVPILAPEMERHGYTVPKVPAAPGREDAVRQFVMAAQFKRDMHSKNG